MATDIWGHIEYRKPKEKFFVHWKNIDDDDLWNINNFNTRHYSMFQIISDARWVSDDIKQQLDVRGLPDDITKETKNEYQKGQPDFHTESWLTTEELKHCIDYYRDIAINKWSLNSINVDNGLAAYYTIYQFMKSSDDGGNYTRLVFWFDN